MYNYKCKIIKIIDGDTVDVDIDLGFDIILKNQRVRLSGIDTPESRTSDKIEKKFGLMSKNFVKDFLNYENIILRTEEYNPTGKFGRILGDFIVNEKSLCEELLNNHLAVVYFGQSKEHIQEAHLKNREILILENMKGI